MLTSKEWQGKWNIVGTNLVFLGTLTYSPKQGCQLVVSKEHLTLSDFQLTENRSFIKAICGQDYSSGKYITLFNSLVIHYSGSSGLRLTIKPNFLIENLCYSDEGSSLYNSATVIFAGLGSWLGISGVTKKWNISDSSKIVEVTYKQEKSIKYSVDDNLTISFHFGYSTGYEYDLIGYRINEYYSTEFSFKNSVSVSEIMKTVEHFRRMFSILFNQYCFTTSYKLLKNDQTTIIDDAFLYFESNKKYFPDRIPNRSQMLYAYKEIETKFHDIVKIWYDYRKNDDIDYVCYILSKTQDSFSEETFLQLARSLEVFLEFKMSKVKYTELEKDRMKSSIREKILLEDLIGNDAQNVSKEEKEKYFNLIEKIISTIDYSNTLSFRKKISKAFKLINKSIDNQSSDILFGNIEILTDKIVNCRNYYTHYDQTSKNKLSDSELSINYIRALSKKIRYILLILLFHEFGLSMEHTASKLNHIDMD